MAKEAPNSYTDPYWSDLAAGTEKRLGLPTGLLVSVLTRGERSNADQVSEAGARTPFQIIPATRKAALDKYGVDAYLSPENSADVAGRLLKDSLERNKGDAALAVAEYHGGTDRANWGPRTRSYVQRVTSTPAASAPGSNGTPDAATIARAYEAYRAGRMAPDAAAEFEQDVNSGVVQLPLGASLKRVAPAPYKVPSSVIEAYVGGSMDPEAAAQFEEDVRADPTLLPDGLTLAPLEAQPTKPGLGQRLAALPGQLREAFTGEQRRTPEIEALPDWVTMPELVSAGAATRSGASAFAPLKAALGSQLAGPDEAAKIVQANFPNVGVRQDEKGNYIFKSASDGKEYAMKPGFRASDIGRALFGVAAFTPAGRATTVPGMMIAGGATQAAIEGTQAATGGDFDAGDVGVATLVSGAFPMASNVLRYGAGKVNQVLGRGGRRAPEPVPQAGATVDDAAASQQPGAPAGTAAPLSTAPLDATPRAGLTPEQLGEATRKAAQGGIGSKAATRTVAQEAAPDPEVLASAKRLGIEEHLQPDHMTTNQAFRELSQVLKSVPGSTSGAAERQGLEQVAQRADDLITQIGGTHDLSVLDANLKRQIESTHSQLKGQADKLYDQVRNAVPARSEAPATTVLSLIEQRAADLGGKQNLSAMEKQIAMKLSAKPIRNEAGTVIGERQPTYALLDDVRRDLTAAKFKRAGAFKDSDDRLIDLMQGALREDQQLAAGKFGMSETWDLAQKTAAAYKGMQDDLASLFGRQVDGSIVGDLTKGVTNLAKGDTSRFLQLLKSIPESMRQEVVASGLATAFGKNARNGAINFGSYARWYEGLQKNQQAYTALMSTLPASAREGLRDLYVVSNGISKATRERITTGRLTEGMKAIEKQLEPADTLMAKVYETAAKSTGGVAAEAFTSSVGMPGAGTAAAIASALKTGRKPSAFEAADKMFASQDFVRLARAATPAERAAAARNFANGKNFTRFFRTLGSPRELSNREQWVLQAMQAQNAHEKPQPR